MRNKILGWLFLISVVIFAIWIGPKLQENIGRIKIDIPDKNVIDLRKSEKITVKRVVDGDTIELSNGEKVRYIGINTPETKDPRKIVECFGKESYEYNKKLVEGKEVTLEKDVSDKDKYGRLLRYVWIDEIMVNDDLIRQGYAMVATYTPDVKYNERLLGAERIAKENRRGLWEKCKK